MMVEHNWGWVMQGPAVTHLSVRVPWQDTRWDGRVCADPSNNQSCVVLKAIAENRNDTKEDGLRGQWMADLPLENKPACFAEVVSRKETPYRSELPSDVIGLVEARFMRKRAGR